MQACDNAEVILPARISMAQMQRGQRRGLKELKFAKTFAKIITVFIFRKRNQNGPSDPRRRTRNERGNAKDHDREVHHNEAPGATNKEKKITKALRPSTQTVAFASLVEISFLFLLYLCFPGTIHLLYAFNYFVSDTKLWSE